MGQITPGPVLSASTFVGYITNGLSGAVAATLGVFLPSFLIVAVTAPLVKKMRENHIAHSFLEGVNSAVVALVLFVCINLAQSALVDVWTVLAMLAGLAVLIFTKAQPYVLVIAGFAIGILRMVLM
jgi:chromate transporter